MISMIEQPAAPSRAQQERIAMTQTQLARAIGVTTQTIRNWEKRGLIVGTRPSGGVKLYAVEDGRRLAGK